MTAPVLMSTVGSLGDLFPVLAVARALEETGQPVRLLLGPDDADEARAHGFEAVAFGPSEAQLVAELDMDRDAIAASVFRDPSELLKRATYPRLADLTRALLPHAQGARAVCSTALAMAAPLAAELTGRPHIPLLLQPVMVQSALDPPRVLGLSPPMVPRPGNAVSRSWNRLWLRIVALEMQRRHGRDQAHVRRELGLPPSRATPLFGHAVAPHMRLGLWDPAFSQRPADAQDLRLTGFARLQQRDAVLPAELQRFLEAGPAPLVVTLGSVAHKLAGPHFWRDAVALARGAGLRAVLLSGAAKVPSGADICALPYAPHAALFPHARAVLHHGGMGTLGQALHAGRPQLILPLGADQPDNAARAQRLGVARRIRTATDAQALAFILKPEVAAAARKLADRLVPDGAGMAARTILAALDADRPRLGHSSDGLAR
ncbi:glycosyltransferase family 1 protein [Maribius pontilimi]|uniref:Glycosyltransferase family 1 protein n=1 Tax=Palleronia pontilimi TaxID=1964209 RepID=A0A934I7Q0_9RHOB|nr:glycosyltransferase [Palleronia pontilimi]MBJ3761783.1 glycosyltransferase family 1 protein [Palleronia pontilimi]